MDDFVSLHNHSEKSLLDGHGSYSDYVQRVVEMGQPGIGGTDHGTLLGIHELIHQANDAGISAVPGCEFYVAPMNPDGAFCKEQVFYGDGGSKDVARGAYTHQTVWAINEVGLKNLFRLSSLSEDPSRFYTKPRIDFNMLAEHSEGLVVATGCPSSEISTRFRLGQDDEAYAHARRLKEVFGDRLYVEIMEHGMSHDLERDLLKKQILLSKDLEIELLATNDSHYTHKHDAKHQEEMLAKQSGSTMLEEPYSKGGTRFAFDGDQYYLKTGAEMRELFPERDFPRALSNTLLIAEMASDIKLRFDPHLRPTPPLLEGETELKKYKRIVNEGFKNRYGDAPDEVKEEAKRRIRHETNVLVSSDYIGYILTVYEFVKWTKENYSIRDESGNILASAVGPGRGCFEPGSLVRTSDGGQCKIENVKPGTKVITHDTVYKTVEDVFAYDVEDEDMVKLTLANGSEIKSTADHLIFRKTDGFVRADEIAAGDSLIGPKGRKEASTRNELELMNDALHNEFEVAGVEHYKYTGKVYDLQVEDVRNYTVEDVTVHNSVGGSIIAFITGISETDPIRFDLYFERFLSEGRGPTYRIVYDDGTSEDLIASETREVNNSKKYIHQLKVGDEVAAPLD